LPDVISQLSEVKKITIYGRGEEALNLFPEVLLQMPQLTEIRLLVNGITEIPEEIEKLQNLRILDLTFNPLDQLPRTILNLPRLFVLAVSTPMLTTQGKADLEAIEASKKPDLRIVMKTNDTLD
jgi:Leucine-rich repeat (LRR) protein